MRIPTRKSEQLVRHQKQDQYLTIEKFEELKRKLDKLTRISRPPAIEEVKRLALMGDFSENAAYQMAKGRLRSINQRITEIEDQLNHAEIINPNPDTTTVKIGHQVSLESNNQLKKYRLLGGYETNPAAGIISIHSPLGVALLDKRIGDVVTIQLANRKVEYKIITIK